MNCIVYKLQHHDDQAILHSNNHNNFRCPEPKDCSLAYEENCYDNEDHFCVQYNVSSKKDLRRTKIFFNTEVKTAKCNLFIFCDKVNWNLDRSTLWAIWLKTHSPAFMDLALQPRQGSPWDNTDRNTARKTP